MGITYDRRMGQYRGEDGRLVPRERVMAFVAEEVQRAQVELLSHTRQMAGQQITLAGWQRQMGATLKTTHLRLMALAAGGQDQLTQRHYGAAGYQLRQQYQYLDNYAQDLAAGKLSLPQALRRSASYAASAQVTFGIAEKISRQAEGFNAGKRLLDIQAKHCRSCIRHEQPNWVPIAEIVSAGVDCECHNNCRCRVIYARVPGV